METVSILIVENNPIEAEEMAIFAQRAGYIVTGKVGTGEAALISFAQHAADVVVFDVHLDGFLDGIQAAEIIKKTWKAPAIFLTEDKTTATKHRIKQIGGDYFLPKPFTENQFKQAVEFALTDNEALQDAPRDLFVASGCFFFFQENGYHKTDISDILYIEGDRHRSVLHLNGKQTLSVSIHLKLLSQKLQHPLLLRVHRSTIVNGQHVKAILDNNFLQLTNGKKISYSHTYLPDPRRVFTIISSK